MLRALHALEPALRLGRTYPQDRTGLTKRRVFQPPVRAIVRGLRRALPRRIAGLAGSQRDRGGALLGGRHEAAVARCHALGAPVSCGRSTTLRCCPGSTSSASTA